MKKWMVFVLIAPVLAALVLPRSGLCSEATPEGSWWIAPVKCRVVKSEILGRNVRLQIGLPANYEERNSAYGVVYGLDGFAYNGLLRETAFWLHDGGDVPELITVGIDLEVDSFKDWFAQRSFILTPTSSDCYATYGIPASSTGGGARFLRCLKEEIIPFVEEEYRADPRDRTLVGHSFGGLFAAYVLFESPQLFNRYLISSPSLPWDDRVIFKCEAKYARTHADLPARVFMSVGGFEDLPDDMMVQHMRELAEVLRLRHYAGLDVSSVVFDGETHVSVMPAAFSRGLRVLYAARRPDMAQTHE